MLTKKKEVDHFKFYTQKMLIILILNIITLVSSTSCPDTFYYFDNDPFINSIKEPASKLFLNYFKFKNSDSTEAHGIIWDILHKSYESCCASTKLKPIQLFDDHSMSLQMFKNNQTNRGIYSVNIESDELFKSVPILSSPGKESTLLYFSVL